MERRRFTREFKLEAVRLIRDRGVSYAQASEDLKVHPTQLRNWVKAFADDPQHAFPGQGQMKPEQLEIARLKREVIKLKAERDIRRSASPAPRQGKGSDSSDNRYFSEVIDVGYGSQRGPNADIMRRSHVFGF